MTTENTMTTDLLMLSMERTFAAPIDRVFDAFTTEEVLMRWFRAGEDWETLESSVDLRVGGAVRLVMYKPSTDRRPGASGVYTEIDRPNRLAFTWIWDDHPTRDTLIEIDFEAKGNDTTQMTFTHRDLWSAEAVAEHEQGWNGCFGSLDRALSA